MRDPARIDRILGKLRSLWMLTTDQRLGQLLENALSAELAVRQEADADGHVGLLVWSTDDDRWELAIDRMLARYRDEVITQRGKPFVDDSAVVVEEILRTVNEALTVEVDGDTILITEIPRGDDK